MIQYLLFLFFELNNYPVLSALRSIKKQLNYSFSYQIKKIEYLVNYHRSNNHCYSTLCNDAYSSIEDLPILQKKDFQFPLSELISKGIELKDCYLSSTSGSSGHPFFFAKDKKAHAFTWANIIHQFSNLGISVFNYQARFYGIPSSGFSRLRERIKDIVMNRYRFNVFDLSDKSMENWIDKFKKNKFVYINGYTSAITLFARYCINKNIVLIKSCPTLKICIVTSETCTPEDKAIIQKAFGIPVVREYGASEIDLIAMEDLEGNWKICESNVFVEAVDENGKAVPDGEEGRLLVTSLHNKAMPFIRYEIGDYGILGTSNTGERLLIALTGRTNDLIQLPSGKKAAGLTFYYISRSLLEKGAFLKEFIIRQISLDYFVFDIVAERDLFKEEILAIKREMDIYLEPGLQVHINRVSKIDRKGSGKIKHFYNQINDTKESSKG